jgi:hypothetical protein
MGWDELVRWLAPGSGGPAASCAADGPRVLRVTADLLARLRAMLR